MLSGQWGRRKEAWGQRSERGLTQGDGFSSHVENSKLILRTKKKQLKHFKQKNNMTGFAFYKDAIFREWDTGRRAGLGAIWGWPQQLLCFESLIYAGQCILYMLILLTFASTLWDGTHSQFCGHAAKDAPFSLVRKCLALRRELHWGFQALNCLSWNSQ